LEDTIGNETLALDWTDQKRTCQIVVGEKSYETVVDKADELIRFIQAEYGVDELYICDMEIGEPVEDQTNFDWGSFIVLQAHNRLRWNRMPWPGKKEYEGVGKGTGLEIRARVEEQLESEVDMWVIKEGTIPVFKELVEDEVYEDVEFTVKPWREKIFKPVYKDCRLFCSVRDPSCQRRMEHAFWLAENKRWEDFVLGWFRDAEISGSEGFKEELEAQVWKAIQKWKDGELPEWSAEDSVQGQLPV
jgi:hypothetical protein